MLQSTKTPKRRTPNQARAHQRGFALAATLAVALPLILLGALLSGGVGANAGATQASAPWQALSWQNLLHVSAATDVTSSADDTGLGIVLGDQQTDVGVPEQAMPLSDDQDADAADAIENAGQVDTTTDEDGTGDADAAVGEGAVDQDDTQVVDAGTTELAPDTSDDVVSDGTTTDSTADETEELSSARTHLLRTELTTTNHQTYTLSLSYGDDALIPEGAVLRVREVLAKPSNEELAKQENQDRPYESELYVSQQAMNRRGVVLRRALAVDDDESVFFRKYLQVELVVGDQVVQPQAAVGLRVQTTDIEPAESDAIAAVLLHAGTTTAVADEDARLDELQAGSDFEGLSVDNVSEVGGTDLMADVTELGELALVGIAQPRLTRAVRGGTLRVLAARGTTVEATAAAMPVLDDGYEAIEALKLNATEARAEDERSYTPALWLSFEPAAQAADERGELAAYRMNAGQLGAKLFSGATNEPYRLASGDAIALAWDTGFRTQELEDAGVTAAGELPKGAELATTDATAAYRDVASLPGADAATDATSTLDTLVAYDLALTDADGDAWQPDAAHPVDLTISDRAIERGQGVQVLAVDDSGKATPVDTARVTDGKVRFVADENATIYIVARTVLATTLRTEDGADYEITVEVGPEAKLPVGTTLQVREVLGSERRPYRRATKEALGVPRTDYVRAFDIKLVAPDGTEVQPAAEVQVGIHLVGEDVPDDASVVHFPGEADEGCDVLSTEATPMDNGTSFAFGTDGFSVFVLSYTVDFHWEEEEYNLSGGGIILLSELMDALDIDDFELSEVVDVTFSDPTLLEVAEVVVLDNPDAGTDANTSLLEVGDTEELAEDVHVDWLLASLAPFTSEEVLTVTLSDGRTIEIPVTDAVYTEAVSKVSNTRVKVDGVTYNINTTAKTAEAYAVENNATFHQQFVYSGATYTVTNIRLNSNALTKVKSKIEWDMVKAVASREISLPDIKTSPDPSEGLTEANGWIAGQQNSGRYQVWKKAELDESTGTITYTLKYFQAMKEDEPLTFIFIYDDSASMYSGTRSVTNYKPAPNEASRSFRLGEAQTTRVMILDAANALLSHKRGYDIQVGLGGTSTGDKRYETGLTSYEQVEAYLSTYNTGTTDYTVGLENALAAARQAIANDRTPIIIWLSDFHQAFSGSALRRTGDYELADQLHAIAPVYGISTDHRGGATVRNVLGTNWASRIFPMRDGDLDEGIESMENVIWDAIGYYMKDKVVITDNLSSALSGRTTTAGPVDAGTETTGTGKESWTLGGVTTSGDDDSSTVTYTQTAATVYTESFTTTLDQDTLYVGDTPTNTDVTVKVGGTQENIIPASDSPVLKSSLHMVLGLTDVNGGYDPSSGKQLPTTKVQNIHFTLTDKADATKTYTTEATDEQGAITIAPSDFELELGHSYTLAESTADVNTHNAALGANDAKIAAPDSTWDLVVSEKGTVSVVLTNQSAQQTPSPTIATGTPATLVIWNNVQVPTQLVPITVQKEWKNDDVAHRYDVRFTVFGTSGGVRYELKAYDGRDMETAKQVRYLKSSDCTVTTSGNTTTWSRTVWVPDSSGDVMFCSVNSVPGDATGHTYSPSNLDQYKDSGGNIRITGTGTFCNYEVEEGTIPTYEDGWYTDSESVSASTTSLTDEADVAAPGAETTYSASSNDESFSAQLKVDFGDFKMCQNDKPSWTTIVESVRYWTHWYQSSGIFGYYGWHLFGKWVTDTVNDNIYSIETSGDGKDTIKYAFGPIYGLEYASVVFENNNANATTKQAQVVFEPVTERMKGSIGVYTNLRLPKEWEGQLSNITVKELTFAVYSPDSPNEIGFIYVKPDDPNSGAVVELQAAGTSNTGDGVATTSTNNTSNKKWVTRSSTDYTINTCTVSMTNTWHPNPLVPLTVVKDWDGAPAAQVGENSSISFTVKDAATGDVLPVHESDSWASDEVTSLTGAANAATWSQMVYVPEYDCTSGSPVIHGNLTVLEEEDELKVVGEDEGEPQGAWNAGDEEPGYVYHSGKYDAGADADYDAQSRWVNASDAETLDGYIHLRFDRSVTTTPQEDKYNHVRYMTFYYHDTEGTAYESSVDFGSEKEFIQVSSGYKDYYVGLKLPKNIDLSSLTLIGKWDNGSYNKYLLDDSGTYIGKGNNKYGSWLYINNSAYGIFTYNNTKSVMSAPDFRFVGDGHENDKNKGGQTQFINVEFVSEPGDGTLYTGTTTPLRVFAKKYLTITNTFTPYKKLTLSSDFTDTTRDHLSSESIAQVVYTIKQGDHVVREVRVAATSSTDGDTTTVAASKVVYLPAGTYTVEERIAFESGDNARLYEVTAYETTVTADRGTPASGSTCENYSAADPATDGTIDFDHTRKALSVQVTTSFAPELADDDDPIADGIAASGKTLAYTLTYNDSSNTPQASSSGAFEQDNNGTTSQVNGAYEITKARQTNTHQGIPTYSVRGKMTSCDMETSDIEAVLPEYDVYVDREEKEVNGTQCLVFTLTAAIKRGQVIVEKIWETDPAMTPASDVILTYTLSRTDGKEITGTGSTSVQLKMKYDGTNVQYSTDGSRWTNDGMSWVAPNAAASADWRAAFSLGVRDGASIDVPVIRSTEKDSAGKPVKYVLSERADNDQSVTYYPTFIDVAGDAANLFEQTNLSGRNYLVGQLTPNMAKFRLTNRGIHIQVTNANTPYICKIVENVGSNANGDPIQIEHPFRMLNHAVTYARNYGDGQDMSADHAIAIQMLVDYEVPSNDKVTLNQAGDNIIITTAETSGGAFNFAPTFTNEQGREAYTPASSDEQGNETPASGDSPEVAILKRGWSDANNNNNNNNNESLFVISTNPAKLTTKNIIFDGATLLGRMAYMTSEGTISFEDGTTARHFRSSNTDGGAVVYATLGSVQINNRNTNGSILFFDSNNGNEEGGAIRSLREVTVSNAGTLVFRNCVAGCGGAIETEHYDTAHITITNTGHITFDTCTGGRWVGGALCTFTGTSNVSITGSGETEFLDCNSGSKNGGAIYAQGSVTLENVSFERCRGANGGAVYAAGAEDLDGCSFTGCSASVGGAVYAPGAVDLNECIFTDCTATGGNGGAIYSASSSDMLMLTNVSINGHETLSEETSNATLGGAVYSAGDVTIKQSGTGTSEIMNCSASNTTSGGAINVTSGKKMYFEGDVVVYDNTNASGQQRNVVLDEDRNTKIWTTSTGLGTNAYVGVYVISAQFADHGEYEKDFATHASTGNGTANLDRFINDVNGYYGEDCPDHTDLIRWQSWLCKLTDANGYLLYYKEGSIYRPAVYKTLRSAIADTGKENYLYQKRSSGFSSNAYAKTEDIKLEMLLSYDIPTGDRPIYDVQRNLTFTTAADSSSAVVGKDVGDTFFFHRPSSQSASDVYAVLKRKTGYLSDSLLLITPAVGSGTQVTLTNITFDGGSEDTKPITATADGALVYASAGKLVVTSGTVLRNSYTSHTDSGDDHGGGAICLGDGSGFEMSGNARIENCSTAGVGGAVWVKTGTFELKGGTIQGCHADQHGGGVYVSAGSDTTLTITGGSIEDCYTSGNGGAIYHASTNDLAISDLTIDGHKSLAATITNAVKGGAIFMGDGELTLAGSEITNCSASDAAAGGAINVQYNEGTKRAKLFFEGDTVVYGNGTLKADGTIAKQKNVVLEHDTNDIINTTATGLGTDAHIGVYVVGTDATNPYKDHGGYLDDFGTWLSDANLDKFTNDRNGMYGEACPDHNKLIRWQGYLCKITAKYKKADGTSDTNDGRLLYYKDSSNTLKPAVYKYLTTQTDATNVGGFTAAKDTVYVYDDGSPFNGTSVNVEMLRCYLEPGDDTPSISGGRNVTLTTAKAEASENPAYNAGMGDIFAYSNGGEVTGEADRAMIKREPDNVVSMFGVYSGGNLTTTNIILDGGAEFDSTTHKYKSGEVDVSGGIVNASGTLTVSQGTTMQNTAVKYDAKKKSGNRGAAIYVSDSGILTVFGTESNKVAFKHCQAAGGGAVFTGKILSKAADASYSGTIGVNYCSFEYCYAQVDDDFGGSFAGGALRSTVNTLSLYHCTFDDCTTVRQGGAVYHRGGTQLKAEYCIFTSCKAGVSTTPAAGGGLETQSPSVLVDHCKFDSCESSRNAGAINFYRDGQINGTISNSEFVSCVTLTASTNESTGGDGFGGAMRSYGSGTLEIDNCTFDGCQGSWGGALACFGNVTLKGTTSIRNCTAKKGGAVYLLNNKKLTINGNTSATSEGKVTDANGNLVKDEEGNPVYLMMKCSASNLGGGVYQAQGICEFNSGTIYKCFATNNGGGVYLGNGSATELFLKGGIIKECYAKKLGGGIYLAGGKTFEQTAGSITGCCAPSGGGIYVASKLTNTAKIEVDQQACAAISGCKAVDVNTNDDDEYEPEENSASGQKGGGIYLSAGTLNVGSSTKHSAIYGCQAYEGGGIYLGDGELTLFGAVGGVGDAKANTAANGGGMYLNGGTLNVQASAEVKNNHAERGADDKGGDGGGIYLNEKKDGNSVLNLYGEIGGTADEGNTAVNGGGIYQKKGTLTIDNSDVVVGGNTVTGGGGAGIYLGGGTLELKAGNIKANEAKEDSSGNGGNGGGIYLGKGTFNFSGGTIGGTTDSDANIAVNGGGIYQGGTLTDSTLTMSGQAKVTRNTATVTSGTTVDRGNGGGVYLAGGIMSIEGGSIKLNTALSNGGGIYLGGGTFTLEAGDVGGLDSNDNPSGGNTASYGGGIYVKNGTSTNTNEVRIWGGTVSGNHATAVNGGGGIAFGDDEGVAYVQLSFQGSIQVWANTMQDPEYPTDPEKKVQCDVCLSVDDNSIINTTHAGLAEESHIGVYVINKDSTGKTLFDKHGEAADPFGTFNTTEGGDGDKNLNRFINNRSGWKYQGYEYYYGVRHAGADETLIYWADYICKIAMPDGNDGRQMLFTNAKGTAPALYEYLGRDGAFAALDNSNPNRKFYYKDKESGEYKEYKGNTYYVEMLVPTYNLQWEETVAVPAKSGKSYTLTIAPKSDDDFVGGEEAWDECGGICTINRGGCTTSMFTTAADSTLTVEAVVIDGGSAEATPKTAQVNGGIFNVSGDLTLGKDATLQNSEVTADAENTTGNGGAIYLATSDASLTMSEPTAAIKNGKAVNGGAVYNNGGEMTLSAGDIQGNTATGDGAGIYLTPAAKLNISGAPVFGEGTDETTYNTTTKTDYASKQNGFADAYSEDKVRQDIYLTETGAEESTDNTYKPASLVVTGDLVDASNHYIGDGSIWVWADEPFRYKQNQPFATFANDVEFVQVDEGSTVPEGKLNAAHLKAFRNAQDDVATENGLDTWLFGSLEGEVENQRIIYWTGSKGTARVILRKVDASSGEPITSNVEFELWSTSKATSEAKQYRLVRSDTDSYKFKVTDADGIILVADLPKGIYLLHETKDRTGANTDQWFYFEVKEKNPADKTDKTLIHTQLSGSYSSEEAARTAAAA